MSDTLAPMPIQRDRAWLDVASLTDLITPAIQQWGSEPSVTFISGSRGSGKTLVARAIIHEAETHNRRTLYTDGMNIDPHHNALLLHLFQSLAVNPSDVYLDAILNIIQSIAEDTGFVWVVDNYDAWYDLDRWLRTTFVPRLPRNVSLVLTGSDLVRRLWIGDDAWQKRVNVLTLKDLQPHVVRRVVADAGVEHPAVVETVTRLANGKPKLLSILLDSLQLFDQSPSGSSEIASFLIEQVLHPGSRRLGWRAGLGDVSADTLLAAASLMLQIDRTLLQALVGRATLQNQWPQFIQQPVISDLGGGVYSLPATLRSYIATVVADQRPWTWTQWRIRARRHLLQNARYGQEATEKTWGQLAYLVRDWAWGGQLHPYGDEAEPWIILREFTHRKKASQSMTAHTRSGQLVASMSLEEVIDDKGVHLTIIEHPTQDPLALRAMLRELGGSFHRYTEVAYVGSNEHPIAQQPEALKALGFHQPEDSHRWVLDLNQGYLPWLSEVSCPTMPIIENEENLAVVKDGLLNIHDLPALEHSPIATWAKTLIGSRSPRHIRAWLLDALLSADLGEWPSGQVLLTLYYVDQSGSHESIAERLNLSRATYFRSHQRALNKLRDALLTRPLLKIDD